MRNSYFFRSSLNRINLYSGGGCVPKLDQLAYEHLIEKKADHIVNVAKVFMGEINDPKFGPKIKKLLAGGVIDRLKMEAADLVPKKDN